MQAKYKKILIINGSIIIILIALFVSINLFDSKHLDNNNNNEQSKSGGIGNDDIDSDTIFVEDNDSSSEVGNAISIPDDEN